MLPSGARRGPGWLLAARGGRTVAVPRGEGRRAGRADRRAGAPRQRAARRPAAPTSSATCSATILLWIERWYDAGRTERRDGRRRRRPAPPPLRAPARGGTSPATTTPRTTRKRCAVPGAALARALAGVTGRTTKELILDRVMLEAARLLRFTELTVGEVARRAARGPALLLARVQAPPRRAPMAYRDGDAREVHASVTSCHWKNAAPRRCLAMTWPQTHPPAARRCPPRCGSAPSSSPSPTSTPRSACTDRDRPARCTVATDGSAALGAGDEDLLVLVEDAGARPAGRHAGLYHVALLYPSRDRARPGRAAAGRHPHGASRARRTTGPTRRSTSPTPTATASSSPRTAARALADIAEPDRPAAPAARPRRAAAASRARGPASASAPDERRPRAPARRRHRARHARSTAT